MKSAQIRFAIAIGLVGGILFANLNPAKAQNSEWDQQQIRFREHNGYPQSQNGMYPQVQNPTWEQQQIRNRERQASMMQQQSQQGKSPQVLQSERWEREWAQQHPNEPMPNMGVLQKMHQGETMANINNGFAQMRQTRQAELQRSYSMSKQRQEQINRANHVTWSPQQWANWDRSYNNEQHQRANDYLEAVRQTGEVEEAARRHREMFGGP